MTMRILFIGDIVGRPGLLAVKQAVPRLRTERSIDVVIANAENVSGGSGCLPSAYRQLREAGIDLMTLGDHIYKKHEIVKILESDERTCKPANFPADAPGRDFALLECPGRPPVAVISLLGRTFMRPVDCPFRAADRALAAIGDSARIIVVDIHAEATADKYLMAHHLKGRVTAVIGTHTHVPTADEQIFPGGTAFICDVGMTGPHDSILGRQTERVLAHALTFIPTPFDVAEGDVRLNGAVIDVDETTARATAIQRLQLIEAI